jgi:hypothetical protein
VLQVDSDAGPRAETAAHRVDEHVLGFEVPARVGMPRFPPLEPRQRVRLFARPTDLHERHLRRPAPRRRRPRLLAGLLAVMRRPRRVSQPFALLTRRELEQRIQGACVLIDRLVRVADASVAARDRDEREVRRLAQSDLVPR